MSTVGDECEERSVIRDKGDIGFIDLDDDKSVFSYDLSGEGPVVISVPFPMAGRKPKSVLLGDMAFDSITIENTTDELVDLWSVKIYDSKPEDSFTLSLMEPPTASSEEQYKQAFLESFSLEDRVLRPGQTLTIWLSCKTQEIGLHTSAVHFSVGDDTIERLVLVMVEDKVAQSMAPNRPYFRDRKKKPSVSNTYASDKFVRGVRPSRAPSHGFKHRIPPYPIPNDVRNMIESKHIPDAVIEGLTGENYASYFKTLIIMEELKIEEDMRDYRMENVCMKVEGTHFLSLEVPGLAERRPSLVNGDYIFATLVSKDVSDTSQYQGYIHRVEAEKIYLKFDSKFHFHHRVGDIYNIQFTYNRLNMRRLYQAIESAQRLEEEFLFPSLCPMKRLLHTPPLSPISSMLNEDQTKAVRMILGCNGGAPYVIHGPPGTGKTLTLIEAILQIYNRRKTSRILVCAPSNSAADHLLEKILSEKAIKLRNREIFRLNALTRPFDDMKPEYLEFCNVEDLIFSCPILGDLMRYRIIISTYISASLLYAGGIRRGHFSHIFLDEAGQASEPETMVPLSHLYHRGNVVVLAGDPMQLGPIVFSGNAETHGLGKSFMERLLEFQCYSDGDENYVTTLVRNYRCHPEILHLPSKLFYGGNLIPCKDDDLKSPRTWVDLLLNKEFPVLFHGIQGCDEREGNNPSWFNRIEASKVIDIVRVLIETHGLCEKDIGVITPYRQQVLKIKNALEGFVGYDVKVGSVEQFQGQEREVIIVSTVRSTVKHNEFDRIHYLGFLSNPKRFNVAITRARSLLIVIGNPHILCKDQYWNKLLWHCSSNNSYKGCFLPEREELFDEEPSESQFSSCNFEGYKNYECPHEEDWGQNSEFQEIPKPVTDEAEWSDGWK